MNIFRWREYLKYDVCVIIRFWWEGKDFLEEREKWVDSWNKFDKIL